MRSRVFYHQLPGLEFDSQFPALGDDFADLVQVDGANVAKSLHLFNVFTNDLRLVFAIKLCSPRCTNLPVPPPLFSPRNERF
jgi:hypothetical protein